MINDELMRRMFEVRDSEDVPEPKAEEKRFVAEARINVGDTVQVKDAEGNTYVEPEAVVYDISTSEPSGALAIEVTGSDNEDEQIWYDQDNYQIRLLKRFDEAKLNEQEPEEDFDEPEEPIEKPKEEEPKITRPKPKEEEAPEIVKEYIGNTEDDHFYFISMEDAENVVEDLQIVDQEGVEKFSAKANSIEVENIGEFLFKGIKELRIESIEFGIFEQYLYPYVFEEEEEEEEGAEPEEEFDKPEEPVESRKVQEGFKTDLKNKDKKAVKRMIGAITDKLLDGKKLSGPEITYWNSYHKAVAGLQGEAEESKKNLIEMKVTDHENNTFDVYLADDGTMDTVIDINGMEKRFDPEFASYWRDEEGNLSEEGLRELALDALSNMEEEEYHELVARGNETPEDEFSKEHPEVEAKPRRANEYESYDGYGEAGGGIPVDWRKPEAVARELYRKSYERLSDEEKEDVDIEVRKRQGRESKKEIAEANMGVDYIKRAKQGMKSVVAAMKDKDFDAVAKYLEDVADDCNDGAKAAKKMKVVADEKEAKAAEDEKEVKEESKAEEIGEKKPPTCSKCNKAHWPYKKCNKEEDESKVEEGDAELVGFSKEVFEVELEKDGKVEKTRVMAFSESEAMEMLAKKPGVVVKSARKITSADEPKKESKEEQLTKSLLDLLK